MKIIRKDKDNFETIAEAAQFIVTLKDGSQFTISECVEDNKDYLNVCVDEGIRIQAVIKEWLRSINISGY